MPPQNQAAVQDPNYTPIDPQKDFLGFVMANKEAIQRMPEDKQLRFVDMLFRRFALPKYQEVNKQKPLDEEELGRLRTQFAARIFGVPIDQETQLKEDKKEPGLAKKGAAALEAGGAGVLASFKTINELHDKLTKNIPIIGKYMHERNQEAIKQGSGLEGKAYDDAQAISPGVASFSAGLGHQVIPSIAAGAAGKFPQLVGKGANIGLRILQGGLRGAGEGATYEATRPGGDPKSGAEWGGVLGAAFPMIGKLFGLGRRTATKAAEGVAEGVSSTTPSTAVGKTAESTSTSLGDIANKVAKEKFGKPFKDLSPAEKTQMPSIMKEEIKKQAAQKAATKKAEVAAAKAGREADEAAKRAERAKEATEKAAKQAEKRAAGTSKVTQATAAKAAEENPQVAKVMSEFKQGEGTAANAPGQTIKVNPSQEMESAKHEFEKAKSILKNDKATAEEKKIATDNYKFWKEKLEGGAGVTKVPEGQSGVKTRAKGGQPASPAQQAADRERIAATREQAKKENFGAALEKHAQEMAGRHTIASLGIMHVPELEATVKEMPEGEYMLKTLQKAKRAYKWSDEIYSESLKEWLLNQFEKGSK